MILQGDSDAAYLVEPDARSRAGGFHFLGNKEHTMFNGPIHVLAKTIKAVMASAMEAEMKALFMNAQLLVEYRQTLEDMGHPQPPTRIRIDNKSAHGVLTGIMKQKRTKSADMNANWVKDRCEQGQFELHWAPGPTNLGDNPTKHHTGLYHRQVRPIYLFVEGKSPTTLQGCNRILDPESKTQSSVAPGSSLVESLRRLVARAGRL